MELDESTGSELNERQKWAIVAFSNFYRDLETLRIDQGALKIIADKFEVSERTVSRICKEYTDQLPITKYPTLQHGKKRVVGRTSNLTQEITEELIEINQETQGRLTIRGLLEAYNKKSSVHLSRSTLFRYCIEIGFYNVDSYLKPSLTREQMLKRVEFVLTKLERDSHGNWTFIQLKNVIHVDEKWFFLVKMCRKIRMYPGDDYPGDDTVHHKSHIPKIMFLAAVGSPHQKPDGTNFDGKIGIWPFIHYVEAQRTSKKRPRGTEEIKGYNVDADSYYEMMTKADGVLASIKKKMSHLKGSEILVQHDGATPHTGSNNEAKLNEFGRRGGWNIKILRQPAQSPDLNKLDLCFFHSLQTQADHLKSDDRTVENMVTRVKKAYWDYDVDQLERVNALIYVVYRSILENEGGNQYDMPHTGIRNRQSNGNTVEDRTVDVEAVRRCKALLRQR